MIKKTLNRKQAHIELVNLLSKNKIINKSSVNQLQTEIQISKSLLRSSYILPTINTKSIYKMTIQEQIYILENTKNIF